MLHFKSHIIATNKKQLIAAMQDMLHSIEVNIASLRVNYSDEETNEEFYSDHEVVELPKWLTKSAKGELHKLFDIETSQYPEANLE